MKNVHRYPLLGTLAFSVAVLSACAEEPREGDELDMPDIDRPGAVESEPLDRRGTEPVDRRGALEENVVMTASFEPAEGTPEGQPVQGSVRVLEGTEPDGDYRLAVQIEGLSPGQHAWHIHSGQCGEKAPVVVPLTATAEDPGLAKPLTPGEGGVAEGNVTVPHGKLSLDQLQSGEYSLHVHERGGVDHGPTVACANL